MEKVIKRDGSIEPFEQQKIADAVIKAALSLGHTDKYATEIGDNVAYDVCLEIDDNYVDPISVETIQDIVEEILMSADKSLARKYIIYRENHRQFRKNKLRKNFMNNKTDAGVEALLIVSDAMIGIREREQLHDVIYETASEAFYSLNSYDRNKFIELLIIQLKSHVAFDPRYGTICANLLETVIFIENTKALFGSSDISKMYDVEFNQQMFIKYLYYGISVNRLSKDMINAHSCHLLELAGVVASTTGKQRSLLGVQTLYDRYLLHDDGTRYESVNGMFMRIAMGLAVNEPEKNRLEKTVAFFNVMVQFLYMPSTPTLFNSGTIRPQLSSCFLTTIPDDLSGIYDAIKEDAMLSKFAGGIGNDWTPVRGLGSHIAGTNGKSQGVIPFMKVANDTAVAVNQCFEPNTRVVTENGNKFINMIDDSDKVLTHDGSYKPVLKKLSHQYDGDMLDVTVNNESPVVMSVTPDHPVLVVKTTKLLTSDQLKQMVLAGELKLEWADAADLAPGYYVVGVKQ